MRPFVLPLLAGCPGPATPVDTDPIDLPTDPLPVPERVGFALYPPRPLIPVGEAIQLRAQALLDDGTVENATADVQWVSEDPAVAAVDASGLVTGAGPGDVRVRGTLDGSPQVAWAHVHGSDVQITAVNLHPASTTIAVGTPVLLSAIGQLSNGVAGDLGPRCTWTPSDPAVATVGASGVLLAAQPGAITVEAACPGGTASASVVVEPQGTVIEAPSLRVAGYQASVVGPGVVRHAVDIENPGGQSGAFEVGFTLDAAGPPTADDVRVPAVGVGPGGLVRVEFDQVFAGARPATITPWVRVDPGEVVPDADRADNVGGGQPIELPGDVLADLEVVFEQAIVFGPTDAGVVISIVNHGPEPATDLVLWFEKHAPGASQLTDLDVQSAERSEPIASLAADESYTWVFTYDQVPFDAPWWSCAFVVLGPQADPNLANNVSCIEFQEY